MRLWTSTMANPNALNENNMKSDNDFTLHGDGSSQPDTDTINRTNTNSDAEAQNKSDGSETNQHKPSMSEARLRANRQNAQKSTGPRTARGKGYSRRNAVTHGLLSKKLLFSADGKPIDEDLRRLSESLHEKYGDDDIRTQLLIDGLVVEFWRQRQALGVELQCLQSFQSTEWHFSPRGNMPNVQRYTTASQRAMLKNLELLDQQPPPQSEADEDEGEAPIPQPLNPTPAPESSHGLTVLAAAPCVPDCGSQANDEASDEDLAATGEEQEAA